MDPRPGTPEWFRHTREQAAPADAGVSPDLPWQVWVCIGVLLFASLAQFALLIVQGVLVPLLTVPLQLTLAYGLYLGKRWAFVLFELCAFASVIGISRAPAAVVVNVGLGVVLLTASDYFFARRS